MKAAGRWEWGGGVMVEGEGGGERKKRGER